MDNRTFLAQVISSLIVLTTIHSQDFEDVEGDRIQGRRTLPLVFPQASRAIMVACLPAWSILLCLFWQSEPLYMATLLITGCVLSARYHFLRSRKSDRVSYILYNVRMVSKAVLNILIASTQVWLSMAQVLAFTPASAANH